MQLVTKSAYARLRNRAPSAVSNWIADGKLTPPAVVDDMIDVALADAQLAERLDPSQQLAQERPLSGADLDDDADADEDPLLEGSTAGAASSRDATKRYLQAKAEEKELEVERRKRNMMAESGRWMETAAAERAFGQKLSAIFTDMEAWVNQAGEELANTLGTDLRATTLALRDSLRAFRERQAQREENAAKPSDAS